MPLSDTDGRLWGAVTVLVVAALLWVSPISPAALSRADVALGQGQPTLAVERYDAVAQYTPVPAWRHRALDRAARVLANELNDPAGARQRTRQLLQEQTRPVDLARTQARLAQLFRLEGRPTRAATEWLAAVEAAPDHRDAPQWWASAADSLAESGKTHRARKQWVALMRAHPEWRVPANLARARIALAEGDVAEALPLFEDVVSHGDEAQQAAGQLGASICLERLGDLDQALAVVDHAFLPDEVRQSREDVIRQRALWAP